MVTAEVDARSTQKSSSSDVPLEDSEGRPTLRAIIDMTAEAFGRHSMRITETTRMMKLIDRKYEPFSNPPDPDLYSVIRPGTAGSLIHKIGAQTVTDTPIVTHPPRNSSDTAQTLADNQERWATAIMQGFEDDNPAPPFVDAAKRAGIGMWVFKGPLFDFDAYPERPDADDKDAVALHRIKQAEGFPFILESIDPRTIVWDESSVRNPAWIIHRYLLPKHRLKSKYPEWKDQRTASKGKTVVEVIEYWSPNWRAVIADEQWATYRQEGTGTKELGVVKNIYGYVPFEIGFGPFGFAGGSPQEMSRSMLYFVEDELIEESRVASLKSWAMQLYGLPPFAATDIDSFMDAMSQGPGAAVPVVVGPSEDIRKKAPFPLEMPRPPAWLDDYDAQLTSKIEGRTISRSAIGEHQPGTTSGVMFGAESGEAKSLLRPIVKKLNRHASRILNRCAWIHEHLIGEDVSLWLDLREGRELVSLKADSWKGSYHFNVDLEPVDPTRDDRRAMLGLNLFAQGLLDPWTVLQEFLRVPDASGVIKRIIKWRVMNSPKFAQLLEAIAAEEAGFDRLLLEQEAAGDLGEGVPAESIGDFEIEDIIAPGQTPGTPAGGQGDGSSLLSDFPTRNSLRGGDAAQATASPQTAGVV